MKRYDTDEDMHKALDVFLFDTLSDPELEFVDAPQEAAVADVAPALEYVVTFQVRGKHVQYSRDTLPNTARSCRNLAEWLLKKPAERLDDETKKARLELALASLQKAVDLS